MVCPRLKDSYREKGRQTTSNGELKKSDALRVWINEQQEESKKKKISVNSIKSNNWKITFTKYIFSLL